MNSWCRGDMWRPSRRLVAEHGKPARQRFVPQGRSNVWPGRQPERSGAACFDIVCFELPKFFQNGKPGLGRFASCVATATRTALAIAATLAISTQGFAQSPSPTPDSKGGKFVPTVAKVAESEGNTAFMRKDYAGARKAYQKVLELVPDNVLGLTNLGVVEFSSGNTAKAEELLKKAISIRLQNPAAWLTLGIIYMDQEHFDEALAALAQAIVQDPRNPRARNYLGVVIGRKGWIDGAESELRRAVELDPSYSDAHYNLAVFYLEEKPPAIELARRHYYRAMELGAEKDAAIEKVLKSGAPKQ